MPEKERQVIDVTQPVTGSSYEYYSTKKSWHESCNHEDTFVEVPYSRVWTSDSPPTTFVTQSSYLRYGNAYKKADPPPKIIPSQSCYHVKSNLHAQCFGSYRLKYDKTVTTDYEFTGCGPYNFIKDVRRNRYELTLNSVGLSLLESMGTGIQRSDSYLPYPSSLLVEKFDQLDGMALDVMIPNLDSGFSLPVFLAELAEVFNLAKGVLHIIEGLPDAVKRAMRSPMKVGSNAWLSTIFGWIPLVNDIQTILNKLWNMDDQIAKFLANAGKVKTFHYQKALSPLTFRDQGWFDVTRSFAITPENSGYDGSNFFDEIVMESKDKHTVSGLTYHATMMFKYDVPILGSIMTRLRAGLDVFGINPSLKDIWALVPLSFVVDWFYSVSSLLGQFDIKALPVDVVIYDFSRSLKYRHVHEVRLTNITDFSGMNGSYTDIAHWTVESPDETLVSRDTEVYIREPGLPRFAGANVHARLPKGWKLVTLGTLIIQRL